MWVMGEIRVMTFWKIRVITFFLENQGNDIF